MSDHATIELEAWKSAFGTTQLTHAVARLEAAENAVARWQSAFPGQSPEGVKDVVDYYASAPAPIGNHARALLSKPEGGGMRKVTVSMGALSEPLSKQLSSYGIPPHILEFLDKDANAITRLKIRGLLSDAEGERTRKRLMKEIVKQIDRYAPTTGGEGGGR